MAYWLTTPPGHSYSVCAPLLAVSNSVVNALGLALASGFVLLGSNLMISSLRHRFRCCSTALLCADYCHLHYPHRNAAATFAFELYLRIALFIQIIVTNCMILGRAESFASRQPVGAAVLDALGTAVGFAIALLTLGAVREVLGYGTLLRDMDLLFGKTAVHWIVHIATSGPLPLALFPPGAFCLPAYSLR